MKLSTLENKLNKLNIKFEIKSFNSYNKEIVFEMNGTKVSGDFNYTDLIVNDFCSVTGYDQASQETQRRFYSNFAHVQRSLLK